MTLRRVLIGGGILLALAVVVLLAVLVGILIGRGQQEEVAQKEATEEKTAEKKTETTENTEPKKSTPPSKKTPPQSSVVGLGETGELFDRTVTVNDVQRPFVFPRNIPRPQVGNEFVLMNVTITNTSAHYRQPVAFQIGRL